MTADAVRPQREPTGPQKRRNTLKCTRKCSKSSLDSIHLKQSPALFETIEAEKHRLILNDEMTEFNRLVDLYKEHLKFMNRSLISPEDFISELTNVRNVILNLNSFYF